VTRVKWLLPTLVLLVAVGAPAPAVASTATFTPVADAYVSAAKPGSNFGSSTKLSVGASPAQNAYLEFTVTIPAGATITSATLRLYAAKASSVGYRVSGSGNAWTESAVTYGNQPGVGTSLASSGSIGTGWTEVSLSGVSPTTLTFAVTTTQTRPALAFSSREGAQPPQLVVTYTGGAAPDPVLVGAGDIASTGSSDEATAQLLDQIVAAGSGNVTVFTAGDNAYESGSASEYATYYDPTWGRHKTITKPTPGNHEYNTSGATGYFGYFGVPSYYAYTLGNWRIYALNSEIAHAAGSTQEQWLRGDLDANAGGKCILAYWHRPRFSSGSHGNDSSMQAFWQALYDFGADVVVSGHDHNYQRFAPQTPAGALDTTSGIREFVVGTGGRSHYAFTTPIANTLAYNADTYGVLKLTLHASSYDFQFVPEAGKSYTDSGSGVACH
jgi:hypothetical protein